MVKLLHRLGFSYKKTKQVPGKADRKKQEAFVEQYETLRKGLKKDEKLYFMDAVHAQHNSLPAYGWIEKVGIWHLFVPKIWNWYSYIDPKATELIIAVRAINVFFSLCLILTGIANLIFISRKPLHKLSLIVMFAFSVILWGTRLVFQIIYPQGSQNPFVQLTGTS